MRVVAALVSAVAFGACATAADPSVVSAPVGGVPPPTAFAPAASSAVLEPPEPTVAAAPSATAVPSPLALPCTDDTQCGTHRCNLSYARCAFPCGSAGADCAKGMLCMMGVCVPPPPAKTSL
jgi:hypothetical protein